MVTRIRLEHHPKDILIVYNMIGFIPKEIKEPYQIGELDMVTLSRSEQKQLALTLLIDILMDK